MGLHRTTPLAVMSSGQYRNALASGRPSEASLQQITKDQPDAYRVTVLTLISLTLLGLKRLAGVWWATRTGVVPVFVR